MRPRPVDLRACVTALLCVGGSQLQAANPHEHEELIADRDHAYRIDMAGTMDGVNTRDPVGYSAYGQAWEPNRFVLMENIGDEEVVNPWLIINSNHDWRSLDRILQGILEPGMSKSQMARAIWDFGRRHRYHTTTSTDEVKDTVKMLNVYGYTLCWDAAYTMSNLWQRAGLTIRRGFPHGHCTTEVFYDGQYHLLGSDEHLLVLLRDNRTVAGEAELSRDHDLMKRSHVYGILEEEDRQTSEFAASLFCYLGPRSGGRPFIGGHRMDLTLRPGEGLRWEWEDRGGYHGHGDAPARLANGRMHFSPPLGPGFERWAEDVTGLTAGNDNVRTVDPQIEASVVYRLGSPYVFVGGRVRVELAPDSGPWQLELAQDADTTWTAIAAIAASQTEISLGAGFPQERACYDYRLRLRGVGGGLLELEIESDLQMAPLSLPALEIGANNIVYTDDAAGPRRVRVVHAWQERHDSTPPTAPAEAMRPPENGQVQGTRVDFGWEPVDGAVDYHFELSRHRDMRFTLSPVFEKLVSRTPSAGQARWRIPYDGLLNPDETYYWRVRARNEDGLWGPWSRTWNFVVRAPGVPQDLALHPDRDAQSILLSWRPSTDGTRPDHYEIYGSNERGFTAEDDSHEVHIGSEGQSHIVPGNLLATTQDTSLQVVGASLPAERGNRGFYRVIAVDADGLRSGASDYAEAPRPFIYSAPPQEIDAGVRQVYDVGVTRSIGDLRSVTDPSTQEDPARVGGRYQASFRDGDELLFLLDEAPAFVTLDRQTGRMILTPGIEDVSTHTITIRVQSNSGGDVQGFDLRVHETTESAEPVP